MTARMTLARDMEDFVGKYYSKEWFRTNILDKMKRAQLEDERIESELESESDGQKMRTSSFININRQFFGGLCQNNHKNNKSLRQWI